ncbi:MAG: ShlB/FhaC/HecB family hemolysin secretion/activation protein [Comamonadaceae bacterium]|nr:MAG: ShlB/FhaC/HecB family hemolysin secretion/activation protein [Comamonadaceae bacterium]
MLSLAAGLPAWAQSAAGVQSLPLELRSAGTDCESCARPVAPTASGTVPSSASATSFRLVDVRLSGAQVLGLAELRELTAPYIGKDVTLADLETLTRTITQRYRDRGYFLAQAVLPVQTVRDGIVEVSILEGRIGKVDVIVAPEAPISEARVRGFLAPVAAGETVNAAAYERAMLLLSDLPGLRVGSTLEAGVQTHVNDLNVEVAAAPRWSFVAEADNHGTREAGRYRAGGSVRLNSPLGIGDNLDARLLVSNGSATQFGRVSYEAPVGTAGWRIGAGVSRVNYELGGEFEALGAQGTADLFDVSLSYALVRQRGHNLFLRLAAEGKRLTDEYAALDYRLRKRVQGVGLGWAWERRDELLGGGYWSSSGTLYQGRLTLRDADAFVYDQRLGGLNTAGSFSKLTARASRLQALGGNHTLYLSMGGQWASKNLDAAEKLALGGPRAVRAYPAGEVLVDQGLIGTAEWRWALNDELTPFVFYDAARGRLMHDEPALYLGPTHRSLRGAGIGLSWARAGSFTLNATLAWRAGTPPATTDGGGSGPRLYVHFQKNF